MSTKREKLKAKTNRDYAAKVQRLVNSQKMPMRECHVTARAVQGGLVLTSRQGLFSLQNGPTIGVADLELAECADDVRAFGMIAAKVGILVLSTLMRTNAHDPGVIEATVKAALAFAGTDLDALRKEAEEDREANAALTPQNDDIPEPSGEPGPDLGTAGRASGAESIGFERIA